MNILHSAFQQNMSPPALEIDFTRVTKSYVQLFSHIREALELNDLDGGLVVLNDQDELSVWLFGYGARHFSGLHAFSRLREAQSSFYVAASLVVSLGKSQEWEEAKQVHQKLLAPALRRIILAISELDSAVKAYFAK